MKAEELTPHQRIEILEDVLKNLESGDKVGGLCVKIENSAFKLRHVWGYAENIISLFTLENARKITDVRAGATVGGYWWHKFEHYDFENRIKFVKWMIEMEKSLLNK